MAPAERRKENTKELGVTLRVAVEVYPSRQFPHSFPPCSFFFSFLLCVPTSALPLTKIFPPLLPLILLSLSRLSTSLSLETFRIYFFSYKKREQERRATRADTCVCLLM